jgi:hypothetical protein
MKSFTVMSAAIVTGSLLAVTANASAQNANSDNARIKTTLRQLQHSIAAQSAPTSPPTTVSREGRFVIHATINKKTSISTQVSCELQIQQFNSFGEFGASRSITTEFSGSTALCTFVIPYKWAKVDDTQNVSVSLSVSACCGAKDLDVELFEGDSVPLPANGASTTVNFNVDL